MSATATFKCPACGGYLEFDPQGQRFQCPYCSATFNESELRRQSREKEAQASDSSANLRSYHCQSCGAEVVTDSTTAATRCYYCHNPVVLTDRLTDEFRPDGVIPFQFDRKAAEEKFSEFIKGKWFIDREFFTPQQMEDFSGVYYPYWLADIDGEASFDGQGTKVDVMRSRQRTVTITRYYKVKREGKISLRNLVRKALNKADAKLSDGIHPYNLSEEKPFAMGYLSGFLAEKRDIEASAVKPELLKEAEHYADGMISERDKYDTLNGRSSFTPTLTSLRYLLLPAWVLTYKGEADGKPYYYMMNGQTGAVCGRLPLKKGKLLLWSLVTGAAVCAVLCLGGALLW